MSIFEDAAEASRAADTDSDTDDTDTARQPAPVDAEVDHPGIPATQFIQKGFREALQRHFS